jgi:hypothetical protein
MKKFRDHLSVACAMLVVGLVGIIMELKIEFKKFLRLVPQLMLYLLIMSSEKKKRPILLLSIFVFCFRETCNIFNPQTIHFSIQTCAQFSF